MRFRRTLIILPVVLSLLCACQREAVPGQNPEAASLCLDLSVPGLRIESKGNVDDPFADNISSWTDWEKVVDGRMMYRLTVFLIEKDSDELVAYRDIYYSNYYGSDVTDPSAPQGPNGWYNGTSVDVNLSSSTQAQISFLYDHPLHKATDGSSFERLHRGTYKLLAVANYSSVNETKFNGQPDGVASYKGLGNGSFDTSVDGIIADFETAQESGTKKAFASYKDYDELVNYVLTSSSSFICPAMPQPLTLAKEIELHPGINTVSGELLRTFSRIRLSVENMSNVDLTVRSLSFSDNTTKDQTYLFSLPENPDRVYEIGTKKAPVVSSSDAIVPFTGSTVIDDLASGKNTKTLFDAYILESRGATGDYTYTLDLEYVGEAAVPQYEKTSTAISTVKGLADGGFYLFQNQNNQNRFLIAGTPYLQTVDVELADLPTVLDESMVMKLISVDSDKDGKQDTETINSKDYPKYIIQTQYGGTTYYLGTPGRSTNIPMIPNQSSATVFTARDDRNGKLTFWSNTNNENGVRDFINVYGGQQDQVRGWNDNDGGSQFILYTVKQVMKAPKYSDPIVLSTIDPVTSVVSPVNTIRRNDFINVLISVSYNKDLGDFEFEVKSWDEVSGSIEFN